MIDYTIVKAAEETWLNSLAEYLNTNGTLFVFEPTQKKFNNGEDFDGTRDFIFISPQKEESTSFDSPDVIVMTFPIFVVTSQSQEEVLVSHRKNRQLRQVMEEFLFSSERFDFGRSMGGGLYSVPLINHLENGSTEVLPRRLLYQRAAWTDLSPEGSLTKVWSMQVTASIE